MGQRVASLTLALQDLVGQIRDLQSRVNEMESRHDTHVNDMTIERARIDLLEQRERVGAD